jgi:hypothetical protein
MDQVVFTKKCKNHGSSHNGVNVRFVKVKCPECGQTFNKSYRKGRGRTALNGKLPKGYYEVGYHKFNGKECPGSMKVAHVH